MSAHPLPAFENMTLRDAYWAAKQVMSFRNEDIRAIVGTGGITNPEAEKYLTDVLIKRRDIIGKYWFVRMNPLDKFQAYMEDGKVLLKFTDLGVEGHLFDPEPSGYEYSVSRAGEKIQEWKATDKQTAIFKNEASIADKPGETTVIHFKIMTLRPGVTYSPVHVFVALESGGPRIVGIQREG